MNRRGMVMVRSDIVLLAINKLTHDAAAATIPDLVVTAWQLAPTRFGLRGYERIHPDSKTVQVALMDSSGPMKRGLVEYAGTAKVRLTEAGRWRVAELLPLLAEAS